MMRLHLTQRSALLRPRDGLIWQRSWHPVQRSFRVRQKVAKSKRCRAWAISPEMVFNVSSVSVMPLYFMMIALPRNRWTKMVTQSSWISISFAVVYFAVLIRCLADGLLGRIVSIIQQSWPAPDIAAFSEVLMESWSTVLTWLNLLIMDFYQARVVFLDGLGRGVWTGHSVLLCFMFGPLGLLSHLITRTVVSRRQPKHISSSRGRVRTEGLSRRP